MSVGLVVGSLGGMLAAFSGRTTETLTMRLVDVLLSIPALLLSLTIIILLGAGTLHAALAVGCASVAHFARLSRAEVLRIRQQDYIEAAFGSGGRFFAVFFRHVLPNALPNILAFQPCNSARPFWPYRPSVSWGSGARRRSRNGDS